RHRTLHLLDAEPKIEGELACLEGLQTHGRLDDHLQDHLGLFLRDLLDLHAATLRDDHPDALGFAVEHVAQIELAIERLGHLDIDALHGLAFRAGLNRDQTFPEQILRGLADLVIGLAELDAASLAASTSMDLCLDGPVPTA